MEDPNSLWNTYQKLIKLRTSYPALMYGNEITNTREIIRVYKGFIEPMNIATFLKWFSIIFQTMI